LLIHKWFRFKTALENCDTLHMMKRCGQLIPRLQTSNSESSEPNDDNIRGTSYWPPSSDCRCSLSGSVHGPQQSKCL